MSWIKRLFGLKTAEERELDRLRKKCEKLQKKGFDAQRNGNLRLAGEYYQEAQQIEDKIVELTTNATVGTNESG